MHFKYFVILLIFPLFCSNAQIQNKKAIDSMTFYESKKDWIKAIDYSKRKSAQYLEQKNFEAYRSLCLRTSKIYAQLNENNQAVEWLLAAAKTPEVKNQKVNNPGIYIELGLRYSVLRDTLKSKKYYHKALKTSPLQRVIMKVRKMPIKIFSD